MLIGGETATLTVRDNGEGISDLDDLFEPFFTTKKPGDGGWAWVGDLFGDCIGSRGDVWWRATVNNRALSLRWTLPIIDNQNDED